MERRRQRNGALVLDVVACTTQQAVRTARTRARHADHDHHPFAPLRPHTREVPRVRPRISRRMHACERSTYCRGRHTGEDERLQRRVAFQRRRQRNGALGLDAVPCTLQA